MSHRRTNSKKTNVYEQETDSYALNKLRANVMKLKRENAQLRAVVAAYTDSRRCTGDLASIKATLKKHIDQINETIQDEVSRLVEFHRRFRMCDQLDAIDLVDVSSDSSGEITNPTRPQKSLSPEQASQAKFLEADGTEGTISSRLQGQEQPSGSKNQENVNAETATNYTRRQMPLLNVQASSSWFVEADSCGKRTPRVQRQVQRITPEVKVGVHEIEPKRSKLLKETKTGKTPLLRSSSKSVTCPNCGHGIEGLSGVEEARK
ncbi:uncharacterized protein [Hetaerina americana]|uniref:uncharacterized protein n=1 Tax=Hetaerina americana TaxID=62018 RepID=UPI003A7F483B